MFYFEEVKGKQLILKLFTSNFYWTVDLKCVFSILCCKHLTGKRLAYLNSGIRIITTVSNCKTSSECATTILDQWKCWGGLMVAAGFVIEKLLWAVFPACSKVPAESFVHNICVHKIWLVFHSIIPLKRLRGACSFLLLTHLYLSD